MALSLTRGRNKPWLHILETQCFRSTQPWKPGPYAPISRDFNLSKNKFITHSHYLHGMDAVLIIDSCSSVSRRFCQKCCLRQLIIVADVCPALSALTTYCSPSIFSAQWRTVRTLVFPCRTAFARLSAIRVCLPRVRGDGSLRLASRQQHFISWRLLYTQAVLSTCFWRTRQRRSSIYDDSSIITFCSSYTLQRSYAGFHVGLHKHMDKQCRDHVHE